MAERFYLNCPLTPGGTALLDGPEAHHLAAVLRARPGDRVTLFNGDGRDYAAEVVAADRKRVSLQVLAAAVAGRELTARLEVAAALPKGDRADFLVEKLTELGVTAFVPLRTERSVVDPKGGKVEKLQRAVVEASKQCGRAVLMDVKPPADWADYCRRPDLPADRWVAHVGERAGPGPAGELAVAVGPEGGFTDAEVAAAVAVGWRPVGLGPRVLRVETAAVSLAAWAVLNGRRLFSLDR